MEAMSDRVRKATQQVGAGAGQGCGGRGPRHQCSTHPGPTL